MNQATVTELKKFPGKLWNMLGNSGVKAFLVIPDYLYLWLTTGLEFNEYYNFEFDRQDKHFRKTYMNTRQKLRYLGYLNSRDRYYILARNKFLTHLLLENLGIPQAELLYYYNPQIGTSGKNYSGNPESVKDFIIKTQIQDFVIKPAEGTWGIGVMVYKRGYLENGQLILQQYDDRRVNFSGLLGKEPLIIERKIIQTRQVDVINPSSLNSIRVMTALYPDGSVKMFDPKIKFGRSYNCTSNSSGNENVTAIIDIETGTILSVKDFRGYRNIKSATHHPDSGKQLLGMTIGQWDKIKGQVIDFQGKIPFIKVIGWDIAVTDRGAVVIEMNDLFDNVGQYISHLGWKNDISDCYNAWLNSMDIND